jgi:hypothetical protein
MTLRQLHEHLGYWLKNSTVDPDAEITVETMVGRVLVECPLVDTAARPKLSTLMRIVLLLQ